MLLSDLVAIALFLFLVWDRTREGLGQRLMKRKPQKESQCRTAHSKEACNKAGGTGTTCYWCTKENNGAGGCVESSDRANAPDCSSNY